MESLGMRVSNINNFGYRRSVSIFGNNKTVNAILINAALTGTSISAADTAILMSIACLDPIMHGTAVYQARAILDVDGDCAGARSASFVEDENTEVFNEIEKDELQVQLIPNPNNGTFRLETISDLKDIKVYNLAGKLVYTKNTELDVLQTGLSAGVYFIKVTTNLGETKTMKIEVY